MKRDCPICHSKNKHTVFQQKFATLPGLVNGYDVVACKKCGFSFADNVPDQGYFDNYYHEMSKYEHQENDGKQTRFEEYQFPNIVSYVRKHIPNYKSRLLEIGCANGGLLDEFKKQGYTDVMGIDPSLKCSQNAKRLYDIEVVSTSISGINQFWCGFDFVIMVAVLEHLCDIENSLYKVRELLSTGGLLFIEVPDVTRFEFYTSVYAPYMEFSVEHINYFSPQSLKALLSVYGFDTVSLKRDVYEGENKDKNYVIRGIFRKRNLIEKQIIEFDIDTIIGLMNYISTSKQAEDYTFQIVNMLVEDQIPVIIWGVGSHTLRLLAISELAKAKIVAFVDSNTNYQGKKLNGIPLLLPEELDGRNELILISTRVYQSKIVNQIKTELKLENKIITLFKD